MSEDVLNDIQLRTDALRAKMDPEHPPESVVEIMDLIGEWLALAEILPEVIEGLDKVKLFKPLSVVVKYLLGVIQALYKVLQIMLREQS
jgi:hypothetical protein